MSQSPGEYGWWGGSEILQGIWQHSTEQNTGLQKLKDKLRNGLKTPSNVEDFKQNLCIINYNHMYPCEQFACRNTNIFNQQKSIYIIWSFKEFPEWLKYHTYRSADKSLAWPGRTQANVSVRMVWISFGALSYRGKKKLYDSSRLNVVEMYDIAQGCW